MQDIKQVVNRYYQIMAIYLSISEQIERCANEDKVFYQDVCLSFAEKMKSMRAEMTDQGFVLCQSNQPSPYENKK